jgi:hypothetical protein
MVLRPLVADRTKSGDATSGESEKGMSNVLYQQTPESVQQKPFVTDFCIRRFEDG